MQKLLTDVGLEADRVRMVHISSAMAGQFAAAAAEMSEQIAALGPSPLRAPQPERNGVTETAAPEKLSTEESKT